MERQVDAAARPELAVEDDRAVPCAEPELASTPNLGLRA